MSATMDADVPSNLHSSTPAAEPSVARKYRLPLKTVSLSMFDPPVGLMSAANVRLAPSYFHSSRPFAPLSALKYNAPSKTAKAVGWEPFDPAVDPGIMSP